MNDIDYSASSSTLNSTITMNSEATTTALPQLPAKAYCRHQIDVEKGLTSMSDEYELDPYTQQTAAGALTLPHPVHTTGVLAMPQDNQLTSRESSTSTLALPNSHEDKKAEGLNGGGEYHNKEPAPKYKRHWMNVLRWEWLSVYRRLNLIVIWVNVLLVVSFAAQRRLLKMDPGAMSTALAANITTAVLFRQEYVVNLFFLVFGCCPPSWPLWIRRLAAKIYHYGGVHSGAGISSVIWLALFDMSLGLQYRGASLMRSDIAIITITSLLNLLLCAVVGTSHPRFREKFHNIWEATHRFGGWSAVALFWANFVLLANKDRLRFHPQQSIFQTMLTHPVFWMLCVITVCLVLPWFRLRKVKVHAEPQSKYAIRLHFEYTNLPLCAAPRFSTSPLMEWHSFAGIPHETGEGFSVLISSIGDWTRKMADNPPDYLWTRGIPVRGVLHVAPIFKKIVLVATGSGIGPVLSLLYARDVNCRILWCTRDPKETYKPNVVREVLRADPQAIIFQRTKGQRDPDLGRLAYRLYQESGAEAVFVISNKDGCTKSRIWLESRGVVVFTPIFDS